MSVKMRDKRGYVFQPPPLVGFQVPGPSLPILILMLEERGVYLATFFSSWKRPFSGIYLC